jgi:membrane protease YdiL (CAAX protease family)
LKGLLALPALSSRQRISLYLSTIAMQWSLAAVIAWRAIARGLTLSELGIAFARPSVLCAIAIAGAAALAAAHWFNLRRIGSSTSPALEQLRAIASRIFPRSNQELTVFCGLALTAGICEEFIFRGFVFASLVHAGCPGWIAVMVSSVLFGLGHAYQGKSAMAGTLLLGTAFGLARIGYDSLFPIMLWHATIDLVAGIAGRRFLLKS